MEKVQIIATNLKILRLVLKQSQSKFAELFHMTQQNYQKYETGRAVPPADRLMEIADALHIPVSALLTPLPEPGRKLDTKITSSLMVNSLLNSMQGIPDDTYDCEKPEPLASIMVFYRALTPDEQERYRSYQGTAKGFWLFHHKTPAKSCDKIV